MNDDFVSPVGMAQDASQMERLLSQIETAFDRGQHLTIQHFQAALQREPDSLELKIRYFTCRARLETAMCRLVEALASGKHAVALAAGAVSPGIRARALLATAIVQCRLGTYDNALAELDLALPLATKAADVRLQAEIQNLLGIASCETSDLSTALSWYQKSLASARAANDRYTEAKALTNMSGRYLDAAEEADAAGDSEEAAQMYAMGIDTCRTYLKELEKPDRILENPAARLIVRANYGTMLVKTAQYDEAFEILSTKVSGCDQTQLASNEAFKAQAYILIFEAWDDIEAARRMLSKHLRVSEKLGLTLRTMQLCQLGSQLEERQCCFEVALGYERRAALLGKSIHNENVALKLKALSIKMEVETALAAAENERLRADALAVSNERLAREAAAFREEANRDKLTGLANRRACESFGLHAYQHALNAGEPLSLALVDIDYFKSVNDRFSHLTGDKVLAKFAAILQQSTRSFDFVGRYGGEEFLIIFLNVDASVALSACERIRLSVERYPWHQFAGDLAITASFGLASVNIKNGGPDLAAILALADTMLYQAKSSGRNKVRSTESPRILPTPFELSQAAASSNGIGG